MENFESFLYPILIAACSAALGVILTIQVKYARTKDEAIDGVKSIGVKLFQYLWIAWLIYRLANTVLSDDVLTRGDVFSIVILSISLVFMILLNFIQRLTAIIEKVICEQNSQRAEIEGHAKVLEDSASNK